MPYRPPRHKPLGTRSLKRHGRDDRPSPSRRHYGRRHQKVRALTLSAQPLCVECLKEGRTTKATISDHIIPISQGGSLYALENRQSLCKSHHDQKTAREEGGFGNERKDAST